MSPGMARPETLEELLQVQRDNVLRSGSFSGKQCSEEEGFIDHPFAPSSAGRASTAPAQSSNIDPSPTSGHVPLPATAEGAEEGCQSRTMVAIRSCTEKRRVSQSLPNIEQVECGCEENKADGKQEAEKEEEHVRCYDRWAEELTRILFLAFGLASGRLRKWPLSVALCAGVVNMSAMVAIASATPCRLGTGLIAIHATESFMSMVLLWKIGASSSFAQFLMQHCQERSRDMRMRQAWIASAKLHVCVLLAFLLLSCGIMVILAKTAKARSEQDWSANDALWMLSSMYRALYRCSWALCLLRINKLLSLFIDRFASQHKQTPCSIDSSWQQWTCFSALAGQASAHAGAVYIFLLAFPIFKMAAGLGSMLAGKADDPGSREMSLPVLCVAIIEILLPLYALRSGAAVSNKCQEAICFVNSLQVDLPWSVRNHHTAFVAHMANSNAAISACGMKLTNALLIRMASVSLTAMVFVVQRVLALPVSSLQEELNAIKEAFMT